MLKLILKNIFIVLLFINFSVSCTCDSQNKTENTENMETKTPTQSVSQVRKEQKSSSREEIRKEVYAKPPFFPEKAIEILADGEIIRKKNLITEEKFKKLFAPLDKLTALKNTDEAEINAVVQKHGFSAASEYFSQLLSVMSCIDAVKILAKLEEMHKDAEKEGKNLKHSQIYKSYFEMSKTLISRAELSEKDIRFVYNNWDKALELKNASRKIRFNK